MKLIDYIYKFVILLGQKQVKDNCILLINKIISKQNCQLWALSENHVEYNKFHRMFDGTLKTVVDTKKLNMCLLAEQTDYFKSKNFHIIVHDPSTIRKPETQKAEFISQVKDLNNKIVNGYMTYNCVAVDLKTASIHLLRCVPYSTEQPEYITQKEKHLLATGKMEDKKRKDKLEKLEEQGKTFNLKTITFDSVKTITAKIKEVNPEAIVIDVYDRGFDDAELFEYETSINNFFVVRSKLNRNSNEIIISEKGNEQAIKLKNQVFFESHEKNYNKVQFKDKTYVNAKGIFEWNYLTINNKSYSVVRIRFYDSSGKKIFTEPMLLITNIQVDFDILAILTFELYMTRSKIEGVFKFCKTQLGWENIQIPEFECVKNLLSFVFFIASYFYEIEDDMTKDPTMIWLAELGGGKGKITKIFILRGLEILINYRIGQNYIKKHNINENQIDEIIRI